MNSSIWEADVWVVVVSVWSFSVGRHEAEEKEKEKEDLLSGRRLPMEEEEDSGSPVWHTTFLIITILHYCENSQETITTT